MQYYQNDTFSNEHEAIASYISCPVCNVELHKPLYKLQHDLDFGVCQKCGLSYVAPLPSNNELAETYNSFKQSYPNPEIIADNSDFSLIAKDRFSFVTETQDLSLSRNLLDIGSGYGLFLKSFKKTNWEVYGVEPSIIPYTFSKNELGLNNIQNCMLADAIFSPVLFDFICSFHVIEHLNNPIRMLTRIKQLLKPEGRLFLATPDLVTIPADIRHYFFLYHRLHLTLFTPSTINSTLQRCGFEIVRLQHENDRSAESGSMIVEAQHANKSSLDYPEESKFAVIYANKLNEMQNELVQKFLKWEKRLTSIAIYGGGVHTQGLLECIGRHGVTNCIKIIFDDDPVKTGKQICNIPIQAFAEEHLKYIDIIVVSSLVSEQVILDKLNNNKHKHVKLVGIYRDILNKNK
jgi:2-polyprenyl-3-methyl-5-hydroxy-6-metoxy-1,4-benzoquinol methylase